jgi:hypothetical protein
MTLLDLVSRLEHPLALGSFRNWIRLLRESDSIEGRYLPRALLVSLSTLLPSPLRLYERLRYSGAVEATAIHPSPVFIVGHWRTGTTYLHHLLSQDNSMGHVSTFQAMAPGFCLAGERTIKPLLARITQVVYPTRVIDNVPLAFDAPQEDEFAVASLSPHAFLHVFTFPRQADYLFRRNVLFDGLSDRDIEEWTKAYLGVLRKATLRSQGNRLVLKSPAGSARIRTLRQLFPDAKFIHMCRNPYDVFLSTRWMHDTVLPRSQLQTADPAQIEAQVLRFYTQLMQRFLADRVLIPRENLVSVKFEDLEAAPLDELRRIYESLALPGFSEAEPAFRAHIAGVADYQKNRYDLTDADIAKVNQHWAFAFEEWGYARLEPAPSLEADEAEGSKGAAANS